MPTLARLLSQRLAHKQRMQAIPQCVIEDVIAHVMREMSLWLNPEGASPDMLDSDRFAACEGPGVRGNGCSNFGAPESMRIVSDEDDGEVIVCQACYADLSGDALPIGGDDEAA